MSSHAQLTRIKKGVGKDLVNENHRKFTPRGMGTLLVLATSTDGKAAGVGTTEDHDLVIKVEDYGLNDKKAHTIRHLSGGGKKDCFL